MKLHKFESAQLFLERVSEFLERNEAVNNLILGLLQRLTQSEAGGGQTTDTFMCVVEDQDGNLVLVILMNKLNLILYGEGPACEEAIKLAVSDLLQSGLQVPGVLGPTDIASPFADRWASLTKQQSVVKMNQGIYRLDKVNSIRCSPGSLRAADATDLSLISDWIYTFADAINETMTRQDSVTKAQDFIRESSIYLWEHEQPVSMVRKARPTRNGICINYVYTPPQFRSKGYASSCVASLSQQLLDEGYQFCALYTDLSNPTSNHIYSTIGYQPVRNSIMYRFR